MLIKIALDDNKKLGQTLKKCRIKKNFTQNHLASISGISIRTISCIETGNCQRGTKIKIIKTLFDVLDIETTLNFRNV